MSFRRYDTYKDSGVGWLGQVPEHWRVASLRHSLVEIFNGLTATQVDPGEQTVSVTRIETISRGIIDEEKLGYIPASEAREDRRLKAGDILFSNINSLNMIGNCAVYIGGNAIYAGMNLLVLRPSSNVDEEWLAWLIKCPLFRQTVESLSKPAINQASISQSSLLSISIPTPPKYEQAAIAAFLDRETAKADALVWEQQRLIELLKEKRQAIISHAVTKGLHPNSPTKDPGVDWLGEVPEHWEVTQLRRLSREGTSITYGIVQAGPDFEGGIPYIRTSDMAEDQFAADGYLRTSPEIDAAYARSKVSAGDVVIAIRATIGKPLIVPPFLDGANLTQGTAKFSPGPAVNAEFICYFLRSSQAAGQFERLGKGATFKEITLDMLRRFQVPQPPLKEQQQLIGYLKENTAQLDSLISEAQSAVDLLRERRAALVFAAVTGKIDVRGLIEADVPTPEVVAA